MGGGGAIWFVLCLVITMVIASCSVVELLRGIFYGYWVLASVGERLYTARAHSCDVDAACAWEIEAVLDFRNPGNYS